MKRLLLALSIGMGTTIGLFCFMAALVSGQSGFKKDSEQSPMIQFLRLKDDSHLEARKRKLPKKPPEPQTPPKTQRMKVAEAPTPQKPQLSMDIPKLDVALGKGNGPFLGQAGAGSSNADVMPLVRIEPQYPRRAAMDGTEGWVLLKFDITTTGAVTNVKVIDSQPRRVFDSAARRALSKWKYKPRLIAGQAKLQINNKVKLEFRLEM